MTFSPAILLSRLDAGECLTETEARFLFDTLLTGTLSQPQIESMLLAIARRGPTCDELVGAARSLRDHSTPVRITPSGRPVLDTCGTGGAPKLFNVSTISAIVIAAAAGDRILVAKHGNRSRTGRGSAELLEALGVNIHASPAVQSRCLEELGICFSFAPDHHPGARHAAAARKALGIPTIFNLLGPIANPAGATCQLIGTYSLENARKLALAATRLGTHRAMVVTSTDGRDELTTTAPNHVFAVPSEAGASETIDCLDLGLARAAAETLTADSLEDSVRIALAILESDHNSAPARDLVMLNGAGGLLVAGVVPTWEQGLSLSREALASGAAKKTLQRWITLSNS